MIKVFINVNIRIILSIWILKLFYYTRFIYAINFYALGKKMELGLPLIVSEIWNFQTRIVAHI